MSPSTEMQTRRCSEKSVLLFIFDCKSNINEPRYAKIGFMIHVASVALNQPADSLGAILSAIKSRKTKWSPRARCSSRPPERMLRRVWSYACRIVCYIRPHIRTIFADAAHLVYVNQSTESQTINPFKSGGNFIVNAVVPVNL